MVLGFSTLVSIDMNYSPKHNIPPNEYVNIPIYIRIIIYVKNFELYNF